jgi:hypothetical protein
MQTTRYCPTCLIEVEIVSGACRRGHRLPVRSIGELRADMDRAFDRAMADVAALVGDPPAAGRSTRFVPPPPPPSGSPPPSARHTPAPPSAPSLMQPPAAPATRASVWSQLEHGPESLDDARDPISAFAPSPRMDWGPDRPSLTDLRNLFRRPSGASA